MDGVRVVGGVARVVGGVAVIKRRGLGAAYAQI